MQRMLKSFSLLLHKFCKCLSETIFGIISRENIRVQQMIQILFKRKFWKSFIFILENVYFLPRIAAGHKKELRD